MAIFTRTNGDAAGVTQVDGGRVFANAAIINTGIAAPLTAYKIVATNGNLAAELTTGGAIETILRTVAANATVLAYQVDAGQVMSLIVERSGWETLTPGAGATAMQTALTALGNIGVTGTCTVSTVSSAGGLKFA